MTHVKIKVVLLTRNTSSCEVLEHYTHSPTGGLNPEYWPTQGTLVKIKTSLFNEQNQRANVTAKTMCIFRTQGAEKTQES